MIKAEKTMMNGEDGVRVECSGSTHDLLAEFGSVVESMFQNMKDDPMTVYALFKIIKEAVADGLDMKGECDGQPEDSDIESLEEVRIDHLS